MKTIIKGRGTGKAKELLEYCRKTPNSFILTQDKRAFQVKANSYGYSDILIIDYNDLKNDNYPLDGIAYVHNGDKVLYELLKNFYGIEVAGFSATEEQ